VKKLFQVTLLAVLAVAVVGCTGDDDDDDNGVPGEVTIGSLGGFIGLLGGAGGGAVVAEFYTAATPDGMTLHGASNDCVAFTPGDADPTVTYLDVGADMTFTNGATVLTAPRDTANNEIDYFFFDTAAIPTGTYDIAVAGEGAVLAGTIGSLELPDPVAMDAATIVPGDPLDITWTGGTGANVIFIDVSDDQGQTVYTCYSTNTGMFTIPAEATMAAGAGGSLFMGSGNQSKFSFEGREVAVQAFGT